MLHVLLELPCHHDIRNALAARQLTHEDCESDSTLPVHASSRTTVLTAWYGPSPM